MFSVAGGAMTVGELLAALRRYPVDARVVGSVGGHQIPHVYVGVGATGAGKEPCVVVADRARFAGQLPDMLLASVPEGRPEPG